MKTIPGRIDQTGRIDVTRPLHQFIASVPNGATVVFPHRARYRIDGTLEWHDRRDITLEGNGATLVAGTYGDSMRAEIRLADGRNWTIRDLTIRGANAAGGRFNPEYQWHHGIDLRGVHGAVIKHVTVPNVFGDAVYVGLSTSVLGRWSRDGLIVDSTGIRSGWMAVSVTAGRNVIVRGGLGLTPA